MQKWFFRYSSGYLFSGNFTAYSYSIVETRKNLMSKFIVTKGPKRDILGDLLRYFQRTCNALHPHAAVTNTGSYRGEYWSRSANDPVASRISIRCIGAQYALRRVSAHHIMHHSLHLFPYRTETRKVLLPLIHTRRSRTRWLNGCLIHLVLRWNVLFLCTVSSISRNWRISGTQNLHVSIPSSLYLPKVMV